MKLVPQSLLLEDVLPDQVESGDVLVVGDVRVQGGLRHEVGPRQGRVHQGVAWESTIKQLLLQGHCINQSGQSAFLILLFPLII